MTKEKCENCGRYHYDIENMSEFEEEMAFAWGTPSGVSKILISVSVLLLSLGGFLWLLHLADIIK